MLAERMPGLLPELGFERSLEVSQIHSVAGLLSRDEPLRTRPPYVAPHHSDTVASIVGGGSKVIRPGAISLAHRGVLFMDEAPEFKPSVHDALRQPLESGQVSIRRSEGAALFPAKFQLVLAANPCECGGARGKHGSCSCRPQQTMRYRERVSGPVRDRIDMHHQVAPVSVAEMRQPVGGSGTTAATADRVRAARERQRRRFDGTPWQTNCDPPGFEFRRLCPLDADATLLLEDFVARGKLTQRGAERVARLAWTLADLHARPKPADGDVREALALRDDRFGHDLGRRRRAG
jgi:magnesium chelatase family protein